LVKRFRPDLRTDFFINLLKKGLLEEAVVSTLRPTTQVKGRTVAVLFAKRKRREAGRKYGEPKESITFEAAGGEKQEDQSFSWKGNEEN
jgi:hypothetical protein